MMANGTNGLKPRCALRIGVVGNRKINPDSQPLVQAQVTEIWQTLFASIDRVLDESPLKMRSLFSDELPRVAVLSSIAAGGDQIGARAAIEVASQQQKICVELELMLPFRKEDYPRNTEFEPDDIKAFHALEAAACQVVRLAGDYSDDDTRAQAYEQARDLLLQNSDLLIAIYDPYAKGKRAGTVETVRLALRSNTPVIAVLVQKEEARVAVYSQDSDIAPHADEQWNTAFAGKEWSEQIVKRVKEQLVLPEASYGDQKALQQALRRLRLLGDAETVPFPCRYPKTFGIAWDALQGIAGFMADRDPKPASSPSAPIEDEITLPPYATFYDKASKLSSSFMSIYRGGFVLSYVFAGLAVAAAVAMLAAGLLFNPDPVPLEIIAILCGAKLSILLTLLFMERASHHDRYQETAADFRYLAELLRPMQWLARLGTYPPSVELPLHLASQDPRRSWMTWLARAVARSTPSVATRTIDGWKNPKGVFLDAHQAVDALHDARAQWLAGQAAYHARRARDMRNLESWLEQSARGLLYAVVLLAALACTLEVLLSLERIDHSWHTHAVVMGAAAAIFPAFIAAFHGLAFQSEAKRLAVRYDSMQQALKTHDEQLGAEIEKLAGTSRADAIARATKLLRAVAADTIEEAGDWKVFYPVHPIHAG